MQALLDQLPQGELYIPLVRNIEGVSDGQRLQIDDGEVKLVPHMLLDEEGNHYAALFSHPELMAPMEQQLGWKTDGEALKFCTVPALFALDMALEVVDDEHVLGLVLNAGTEYELALRRAELASLTNGKAIPLVGYVANLEPDEGETTLHRRGRRAARAGADRGDRGLLGRAARGRGLRAPAHLQPRARSRAAPHAQARDARWTRASCRRLPAK